MKRRLYLVALILFALCFAYDLVVWGSLPQLAQVGPSIVQSANREAPLAATYIGIGSYIDAAVPSLQAFGERAITAAIGDGFERIRGDATVAMDLIFDTTWNVQHRWLKTVYWAAPLFLLLSVVLWTRRLKQIRTLGRR
jgi:hypothetical protein